MTTAATTEIAAIGTAGKLAGFADDVEVTEKVIVSEAPIFPNESSA